MIIEACEWLGQAVGEGRFLIVRCLRDGGMSQIFLGEDTTTGESVIVKVPKLEQVEYDASYVIAFCDGGYTTNLPLEEVLDGKAWVVYAYEGQPLPPEHGGPARLLVPHLYFWKSAKWVRGLRLVDEDEPGFWESLGYNNHGDPWKEERYRGD